MVMIFVIRTRASHPSGHVSKKGASCYQIHIRRVIQRQTMVIRLMCSCRTVSFELHFNFSDPSKIVLTLGQNRAKIAACATQRTTAMINRMLQSDLEVTLSRDLPTVMKISNKQHNWLIRSKISSLLRTSIRELLLLFLPHARFFHSLNLMGKRRSVSLFTDRQAEFQERERKTCSNVRFLYVLIMTNKIVLMPLL